MSSVIALTILLCIYACSEVIAHKTKAVLSTVLAMAIILLIGFWSGLLPKTIIADAYVDKIGNLMAGFLIVSLGTTLDFSELKRQWKVVATSLICVIGAVVSIIWLGGFFMERSIAISGAPIFAGGSAATLIMTTALKEKGLDAASTFCVVMYVTQKFIGIPMVSLLLRREAKFFLKDSAAVQAYYQPENSTTDKYQSGKRIKLPREYERPSVYLAKIGLVATIAQIIDKLSGGIIHYFVICLIMGIVFFALGFLDKNILAKTQSNSLITFLVTIIIFSNLATTTPQQIAGVLIPLIIMATLGVIGVTITGFICSKIMNISFRLAVSLGMTCTFGFPTTMLMSEEIADTIGSNEQEKTAIKNYLLPKMLTAGFVTVTIASVLIAGVVVNKL
jgi:MFS family permease